MQYPKKNLLGLLLALAFILPVAATAQEGDAPGPDPAPASQDALAKAIKEINEQDNGLTVNAKERCIDVKATVCLRTGEFLEMFACTRDTREHESILVLDAKPSTIHFGLLLLGLEPGKPLTYNRETVPHKPIPATGPKIKIYIVRQIAGQERETPANRWVMNSKTKEIMPDNTWIFAGSVINRFDGKSVYLADVNGSAISLVNFGDDLLTLNNTLTKENNSHDMVWAPRTRAIPKVGTEVVLRLRAPAPAAAEEPQEKPDPDSKARP